MPDGAPQTGQIVWRYVDLAGGVHLWEHEGSPVFESSTKHALIPFVTAAAMFDVIAKARMARHSADLRDHDDLQDALDHLDGLTPPEPKEGGA